MGKYIYYISSVEQYHVLSEHIEHLYNWTYDGVNIGDFITLPNKRVGLILFERIDEHYIMITVSEKRAGSKVRNAQSDSLM